jgi:hypothetical protein
MKKSIITARRQRLRERREAIRAAVRMLLAIRRAGVTWIPC